MQPLSATGAHRLVRGHLAHQPYATRPTFGHLLNVIKLIAWTTWPAWPIALWTLWRRRLTFWAARNHGAVGRITHRVRSADSDSVSTSLKNTRAAGAILCWLRHRSPTCGAVRPSAGCVYAHPVYADRRLVWLGWSAIHFGWPEHLAQTVTRLEPGFRTPLTIAPPPLHFCSPLAGLCSCEISRAHRYAVFNTGLPVSP